MIRRVLNLPRTLWAVVTIIGLGFLMFYRPSPPIVPFGTDRVEPTVASPGDSIAVYRTFRATRTDVVFVSRALIRGDCKADCEIVDLPSGTLTLQPGEYVDARREHRLPLRLTPGIWKLVFSIRWQNILGGMQTIVLPPLSVEVVERR